MPGVRIVTDSACDLTDDLVKQHDVIVVPLTIRFGAEEFEDRRELTPEEFWRRCQGKGALPETAAPSPGAFIAAYQQAADEGADGVLCLTISSKLSATYASAVTAADTFTSIPVQRVRHPLGHHGPGPHGDRRRRGIRRRGGPGPVGRGRRGPHEPDPRLRRAGGTRLPPARWPHRRRPGPFGLAPLHQARHHGQRRRGGRGVQTADPLESLELPGGQGGARTPRWNGWPSPTAPATTSTTS